LAQRRHGRPPSPEASQIAEPNPANCIDALRAFAFNGIGFVLRRTRWLTEAADASLLTVVIQVLTPCLILDATLGNPALRDFGNLGLSSFQPACMHSSNSRSPLNPSHHRDLSFGLS
jgi:hypothetical protein